MKKYIFIAFVAFFSNTCFAYTEINKDSLQIYYDLIAEENFNADYKPNKTGIIVGGTLTGIGLVLVGIGVYAVVTMPDESKSNDFEGHVSDAFDALAHAILATYCFLGSVPFLGVGIPVLSYNIYQYNVHKNHANKRDEYQNALDRYKLQRQQKKSSVKVIMFPSFDFENHGGKINTTILF